MCPSEDRCLECDWGLRLRRRWRPDSVCHLCGCSPTTGFDYLLLLECEIWICLFITQSLACVGAWATAEDCLVVAGLFFFFSLSSVLICCRSVLLCSSALCTVPILQLCVNWEEKSTCSFSDGKYGLSFGFLCPVGLKWFQKLQILAALTCIYHYVLNFQIWHFLHFNWKTGPEALSRCICDSQNTGDSH